jgi:orotate phosphoribosyltransferase
MSSITDKVANALFSSGCLKFGSFKIKSGAISPYYIDLARLLSSPKQMCFITDLAAEQVKQIMVSDRIDKLASIELKGALIVANIACKVNLPCIVVRKEEKVYGVTGRIAGADIAKGDDILFFDDVISEGLSKIEGIKPLQELGGIVKHMLVVVNREQGGKEKLEKLGFRVHALANISGIADSLYLNKHISKEQADDVLDFVKQFEEVKNTA